MAVDLISSLPRRAISALIATLPAEVVAINVLLGIDNANYALPEIQAAQIAYWVSPDHYPTGDLRVRVSMVGGGIAQRTSSRRYSANMALVVVCEVPATVLSIASNPTGGVTPTAEQACGQAAWDLAHAVWRVLTALDGVLALNGVLYDERSDVLIAAHDFTDTRDTRENESDVDVVAARVVLTLPIVLDVEAKR